MTYANGNGPGAIVRQQPAPRNSLDYWNKSEDWQGVTTYYRSPNGPRSPYGMENIYAQSPTRIQRPAPFPLNLPVSKPSEARRLPQTRNPSAPEGQGTYQNVPVGSRARQEARKPSPPKDSPIFQSKTVKQGAESLIWSAAAPTVPTHHNHLVGHHHNNHVAPVSNSPQITRVEVRPGPGNNGAKDHHRSTLRRKPKWGSLVRSLCCCISQEKADRNTFAPPPSSSLPITQVQKNGSAYPDAVPPHYQPHQRPAATAVTIPDKAANNDYTPSPIPVAQPSPLPKSNERHLLPQLRPADSHKKCLIIDLDETLVHSSFKPVKNADFVIPVEIDGVEHKVYVLKRPYVDEFLERVGERFECVLFTASLAKYADPVADLLDKRGVFRARLFREACVYHKGNYVKDLARLGRDLNKVIIIDNSPASYAFHPENAIPVQTWFDDPTDCELLEILPLLERMERIDSVYQATRGSESPTDVLLDRS